MLDPSVLNRMLAERIRDVATTRLNPTARTLQMAAGLYPLPPKTDLGAQELGEIETRTGLARRVVFHSRPGLPVPALIYGANSGPTVVLLMDTLDDGMTNPAAQAFGVSLSDAGYEVAIIEAPGLWEGESRRSALGGAFDAELRLACPALGQYAWDAIRTIDYLNRDSVWLVGVGVGAQAAMIAAGLDERVRGCVCVCAGGSLESTPSPCRSWLQLPGGCSLGDIGATLMIRGPVHALFVAAKDDKHNPPDAIETTVRKLHKRHGKGFTRMATFLGPFDFNRRMRETIIAFLDEGAKGKPAADYVYERIPLTDGLLRTEAANTLDPISMAIDFSSDWTYADHVARAMAEPYPEIEIELIPWLKYGNMRLDDPGERVVITDDDSGTLALPFDSLDYDALCAVGLSGAEFLGQILHLTLPGAPTGWESTAVGADALTAMIASVRTLVGRGEPAELKSVDAIGPGASLCARALKRLRPELEVTMTHTFSGWMDAVQAHPKANLQPGARYLKWE